MSTPELKYNLRQGFEIGEIKKIETVCNVHPVTGKWTQPLVDKVKHWQEANGIKPDGKVWNSPKGNTWPAILKAFEESDNSTALDKLDRVSVGLWIDDTPSQVSTDAYIQQLQALNISQVAIMVNKPNTTSSAPPWQLNWSSKDLEKAGNLLKNANIDLILTAWPRPAKNQIDEMCNQMESLLEVSNAGGFEVDTEGNWKERFLENFDSLHEAGKYLISKMRAAAGARRLSLTTHCFHPEMLSSPTVSPYVDEIVVQAYSRYKNGESNFGWDKPWGPWGMQQLSLSRAKAVSHLVVNGPTVACGLGAWDQEFPHHTAEEAMQRAVDSAIHQGVDSLRYWSSKWVIGKKSKQTPYAKRFISTLPIKVPTEPPAHNSADIATEPTTASTQDVDCSDIDVYNMVSEQTNPAGCKMSNGAPYKRDKSKIDGIVIHQTAVTFGVGPNLLKESNGDYDLALRKRALKIKCHAVAFRRGFVVQPNDLQWQMYHANGFNPITLGLEIEGCYPGLSDKPKATTWGGKPTPITDTIIKTARRAVQYMVEQAKAEGIHIKYIYAHRQSSPSRQSDPGEDLWRKVVLEYAVPVLGLETKPLLTLEGKKGPGRPIPKAWDPNGQGKY